MSVQLTTANNYAYDILETAALASTMIHNPEIPSAPTVTLDQSIAQHASAIPAANSLLLKLETFKKLTPNANSFAELQEQLTHQIQQFEQQLKLQGIPAMLVLVYRYLLCTVVDEAILLSPWGQHHAWGQHSLLTIFHQDNQGGEKFFTVLNNLLQQPQRNMDVLEFIYLCLSLGFVGKYQLYPDGQQQLETLRQQLYRIIRQQRSDAPLPLSTGYPPPLIPSFPHKHWLLPLIITILMLAGTFSGCKWALWRQAKPVMQALQSFTVTADMTMTPSAIP